MPSGVYQSEKRNKFLKGHKIWLGKKHTKETKKKISETNKGKPYNLSQKGKKFSKEHKTKISLALKGKSKFWLLGRKRSVETRNKMSKSRMGLKLKRGYINSQETRKKISLAKIKSPNRVFKNTSIEIKVQNLLRENEIEFETNYPILGRPDIFIKPNICIFVDGCYWHKCPECGFGGLGQRDKYISEELQKQGYIVYRIWEHEIKNNQFNILNQLCQK